MVKQKKIYQTKSTRKNQIILIKARTYSYRSVGVSRCSVGCAKLYTGVSKVLVCNIYTPDPIYIT